MLTHFLFHSMSDVWCIIIYFINYDLWYLPLIPVYQSIWWYIIWFESPMFLLLLTFWTLGMGLALYLVFIIFLFYCMFPIPSRYTFQLANSKRGLEKSSQPYQLDGSEALGSYLRIKSLSDDAIELSTCSIQWYRLSCDGANKELISGIYVIISYVLFRRSTLDPLFNSFSYLDCKIKI